MVNAPVGPREKCGIKKNDLSLNSNPCPSAEIGRQLDLLEMILMHVVTPNRPVGVGYPATPS